MKKLLLLLTAGITVHSSGAFADCKSDYGTLFKLAAENTMNAKGANAALPRAFVNGSVPTAYSGPNRGQVQLQERNAVLYEMNALAKFQVDGLAKDQAAIMQILINSKKCFPGLSETDIEYAAAQLSQ